MSITKPEVDLTNPEIQRQLLEALAYKNKFVRIDSYFPKHGPLKRSAYKKHMLHYKAGAKYPYRLFMCANQVGKTQAAGIELVYHTTGQYPEWWEGKRFAQPQNWWVCGVNYDSIRKVIQERLLGKVGEIGTGLYPLATLDKETMTQAKKVDTVITDFKVLHVTGGYSQVGFKSYDQGASAFYGAPNMCIWLDEEPPLPIYTECLTRTAVGDNLMMMTFTPLAGRSDMIDLFLGADGNYEEGTKGPGKWLTNATWDDVPHIPKETKAALWASYPERERDARTKGIPVLGEGAVYPIGEADVFMDAFPIPEHFKRVYAIDFGYRDPTAILWGAIDPETGIVYVYAESYLKEQPPANHANIIKQRNGLAGFPIPGVCDPSGGGLNPTDGKLTRMIYQQEYGINFRLADNSILSGISKVLLYLAEGKLKIFNTCVNTRNEYRSYQWGKDNRPKKGQADHAMDALRYLVTSGLTISKSLALWKAENMHSDRDYLEDINPAHYHQDAWLYR